MPRQRLPAGRGPGLDGHSVGGGVWSRVTEVGAVIIVGGNIAGNTRVLTTAIVLETRKGEFAAAIALGIILLLISFTINLVATRLQGRALAR